MDKLFAGVVVVFGVAVATPVAQDVSKVRTLNATSTMDAATLRDSDRAITTLMRSDVLKPVTTFEDVLVPGRRHERLQQVVNGVPVWASTVTRQTDFAGIPVSIFGDVYEQLQAVSTEAKLSPQDARQIVGVDADVELGDVPAPLYVLITERGPRLVYVIRAARPPLQLFLYFIDATNGAVVEKRDDVKRQSVGVGIGVLGTEKKISTTSQGGTYVAVDALRPPLLDTFNLRANVLATVSSLNGQRRLASSDLASDTDNRWTDAAVVDAHVHAGWTYDYLFKRFGRLGLDNRNLPITNITHPASFGDVFVYGDAVVNYLTNAGYYGDGRVVYGDGLPVGITLGGQTYDALSGALDVVAHELTHGVTDYTSRLEYRGESGALNEAFSDMIGTSVEFYFQPAGEGRGQADYRIGEDVIRPGGVRSLANPASFGQPDHFSRFVRTTGDNGGVHINSGIPNQAFYLAIEGGRNRTSGLAVSGVGSANREQIEKVFYRAFTSMLPATAGFSTARAATIQAARDLYGIGSAAERAVTEAWTAVGVL